MGLGRVALAQDRDGEAEDLFRSALEYDPDSTGARLGLAAVARRAGDPEGARRQLEAVLERDRMNPEVHQLLFDLTGVAPRTPPASAEASIELADRYPYDLWANARAARILTNNGDYVAATKRFEKVLALADLDFEEAKVVARQIALVDPNWKGRTIVPVHVYADETVRRHPGWRFRVRWLLLNLSVALGDTLNVAFVPGSIDSFDSEGAGDQLEFIAASQRAQSGAGPPNGIIAVFTERRPPQRPGTWKLGQAEFLGRRLVVRLNPDEQSSRTLIHEVLHLYGAMHVTDRIDSIMNPSGDTTKLDPMNARIVASTRSRRFSRRGLQANVLSRIDIDETTAAYLAALRVNLRFRQLGILDAIEAGRESRYEGTQRARQIAKLDPHLADTCRFTSRLLARSDRQTESLILLEWAARLYGRNTPEGHAAQRDADVLRHRLEIRYGVGAGSDAP